jgi:hypothetical protein
MSPLVASVLLAATLSVGGNPTQPAARANPVRVGWLLLAISVEMQPFQNRT